MSGGLAISPDRARFSIGPLCRWVMPVSDFEAWVQSASAGEVIVYAKGQALAQGSATVLLARELGPNGAKMVELLQRIVKVDDRRETEWFAVRVRKSADAAPLHHPADGPSPRAGEVPDDSDEQNAILRAFRRAVNLRAVAPTNAELASICGLSNGERARYLVGKLISRGLIKVSDQGPRARRIVTIVATGRETVGGKL